MRLAAAVLLVAALVLPVAAQPPAYTQAYVARIALGDIPTTPAQEGDGWNVVEQVRHGNETMQHAWSVEAEGGVRLTLAPPPGLGTDSVIVLYVPDGYNATAPGAPTQELRCTQGGCTIREYRGTPESPLAAPFTVHIAPAGGGAEEPAGQDMTRLYLVGALAFLAGCLLWALLVSKGVVQKRSRKQVVATSAHAEIAARETRPVLEARKRALMAALKEVELAHQAKEMDTAAYDAVKADLKRQTVNVMRALEAGEGQVNP